MTTPETTSATAPEAASATDPEIVSPAEAPAEAQAQAQAQAPAFSSPPSPAALRRVRRRGAAAGVDPGDLEQAVWLRLLERLQETGTAPERPAEWLRRAVRAEARRARRTHDRERPYQDEPAHGPDGAEPEHSLLVAEGRRTLRAAVTRTPGRCPKVLTAMLDPEDPTYREIAGELGISQGSLGPMRSRCLGCLRRMLAAEVPAPGRRGRVR
ncbi:sigma-70 family RNA polymerase sigma factor [Streptomyces diastatochromogenes]|nr:sigma-70 family RNA polymerase sigma factor [Streptomyces diastatochromogenes]